MEQEPPELPTSKDEPIALVTLVLNQVFEAEKRLGKKIDEHTEAVKQRWASHDTEHVNLRAAVDALERRVDEHLSAEERERLVFNARLGPYRTGVLWLRREWRTVVIVALLVSDFVGQAASQIHW